jgi:hypothetical protein
VQILTRLAQLQPAAAAAGRECHPGERVDGPHIRIRDPAAVATDGVPFLADQRLAADALAQARGFVAADPAG